MRGAGVVVAVGMLMAGVALGEDPSTAKDLLPVTMHPAPAHAKVVIVEAGEPRAVIVTHAGVSGHARQMVNELQTAIQLSTGAELAIVGAGAAESHTGPKIHIGDWDGAAILGLRGADQAPEGFVIRTDTDAVHIVGNGDGLAWGIGEFLERFVGVRWFWPLEVQGRSVLSLESIVVEPVHLSDAPHFRNGSIFRRLPRIRSMEPCILGICCVACGKAIHGRSSWPCIRPATGMRMPTTSRIVPKSSS